MGQGNTNSKLVSRKESVLNGNCENDRKYGRKGELMQAKGVWRVSESQWSAVSNLRC